MKSKIICKISPDTALLILKKLAEQDPALARKIETEAKRLYRETDTDEICEDVYSALDGIEVEDLWDSAGPDRHGYTPPEDRAVEMMEEESEPYNREVGRLSESVMPEEAGLYCMGVLKGIYKYACESQSEFKDWAADIPEECFCRLLEEWGKRAKNNGDIAKMKNFLEKECGDWKEALKTCSAF